MVRVPTIWAKSSTWQSIWISLTKLGHGTAMMDDGTRQEQLNHLLRRKPPIAQEIEAQVRASHTAMNSGSDEVEENDDQAEVDTVMLLRVT